MVNENIVNKGRAKWERRMSTAGQKWKAGVSGKEGAYQTALGAGPLTTQAWSQGVNAVSAEAFQAAVAGKGEKWARKFREGVSK